MAKISNLVFAALLGLSQANWNSVSQGVVRIDLERKERPHESVQLSDTIDMDKMIIGESEQELVQNG
jgi:hypothetical protein